MAEGNKGLTIDLAGRVAIVTGAGGGLGKAHAFLLAQHGARVVVNDAGGGRDGTRSSSGAAQVVVDEIRASGGEAIGSAADVTDFAQMQAMVEMAEASWGRVDILVNNAGILRDRTFAKMDLADFRAVVEVHLMGAVNATKAVWAGMAARGFGRIIMTTSSSGLYGNFGQSNYGAAKMALVGLMRTLSLEGTKANIRVNCLSPSAATRLTEDVMTTETLQRLTPEAVAPAVVALCAETAPTGIILCAGAGTFEQANITLTRGVRLAIDEHSASAVLDRLDAIAERSGEMVPASGWEQCRWELERDHVSLEWTA